MQQQTNAGIRPGFRWVMAGALGIIIIGLGWVYRSKAPATAPDQEPAVAVATEPTPPTESAANAPRQSIWEETWGIRISSVKLTMSNAALDMTYTVVAPEKAALLANSNTNIYLVDKASGASVSVNSPLAPGTPPSHSRARSIALMAPGSGGFPPASGRVVAGKSYSVLLPNPGGVIKEGSQVSLVAANMQSENFTVE